MPLFSILSSLTANNTRVGNKADMGLYQLFLDCKLVVAFYSSTSPVFAK